MKPSCPALLAVLAAAALSACGPGEGSSSGTSSSGGGGAAGGGGAGGAGGGTAGDADADGDYLTDAEEASLGTDPQNPDTDGDGYLDGDEVLEKKDPLDPESRIYEGGWPYQRFKDDIMDPGFAGSLTVGGVVARLVARDQFGEELDLYDFAKHGHPVVIDLSAPWCGPCKELASWLAGMPSTLNPKPEFAGIPDMVNAGEVYWITVVFEDAFGNAAGPDEPVKWAEAFPNDKIAVVADNEHAMYDYVFPGGFPSVLVLNEDMTVRAYDRFDYDVGLQSLVGGM